MIMICHDPNDDHDDADSGGATRIWHDAATSGSADQRSDSPRVFSKRVFIYDDFSRDRQVLFSFPLQQQPRSRGSYASLGKCNDRDLPPPRILAHSFQAPLPASKGHDSFTPEREREVKEYGLVVFPSRQHTHTDVYMHEACKEVHRRRMLPAEEEQKGVHTIVRLSQGGRGCGMKDRGTSGPALVTVPDEGAVLVFAHASRVA